MRIDQLIDLVRALTWPFIAVLSFTALIIFRKPTIALLKRLLKLTVSRSGTQLELGEDTEPEPEKNLLEDRLNIETVKDIDINEETLAVKERDKIDVYIEIADALKTKDKTKATDLYDQMYSQESDALALI